MKVPAGRGKLVLYLDYDGVLHHENVLWHPKIGAYLSAPEGFVLFQHAELLERVLEPYPDICIVLSTSWMRSYGCDKVAGDWRDFSQSYGQTDFRRCAAGDASLFRCSPQAAAGLACRRRRLPRLAELVP